MGDTSISWTDKTWNPVRGCSRVSEGCRNCYAERQAFRFAGAGMAYEGLVKPLKPPRWTGEVKLIQDHLGDPLRWKKPQRIFVNSMSDLFHEKLTDDEIETVFAIMALAPRHTFQVLTKRATRMREWMTRSSRYGSVAGNVLGRAWEMLGRSSSGVPHLYEHGGIHSRPWPLPNVWLGVSVENQDAANERIPELLRTPATVRFLSMEPLIGSVDLTAIGEFRGEKLSALEEIVGHVNRPPIGWVIAGCESGPGARQCETEWLRSIRNQCAKVRVPFFLKQAELAGETGTSAGVRFGEGSKTKGTERHPICELPYLDGVQHAEFP